MKILAFDTTNSTLSVAVVLGEEVIEKNILESNKQAEMLLPLIEECLREAKIWYQDLDLIAFTNGPGSFTGIRVGYSCAKALQIANQAPVVAVNSLEAIAYGYRNDKYKRILVVNDAKLEEFFIQEFKVENNKIIANYEPQLIAAEAIGNFLPKEDFLLLGSGKSLIKDLGSNCTVFLEGERLPLSRGSEFALANDGGLFISAKNIALLAREIDKNQYINQQQALYIRQPKISLRKI